LKAVAGLGTVLVACPLTLLILKTLLFPLLNLLLLPGAVLTLVSALRPGLVHRPAAIATTHAVTTHTSAAASATPGICNA
jgi:hypothetical protein